jgi:uroporphyrinogen-III synthase
VARHTFPRDRGALRGRRVLLTCGDALLDRAADAVRDLGGRPILFPLIRLTPVPEARQALRRIDRYDWVVLTSPSAVRFFFDALRECGGDLRALPRLAVSGPATARELSDRGLVADLCPERDFGGKGLLAAGRPHLVQRPPPACPAGTGDCGNTQAFSRNLLHPRHKVAGVSSQNIERGARLLRLRSDEAGAALALAFRERGVEADDVVLYRNEPMPREILPAFDAALFASRSAVNAFVRRWGAGALTDKTVAAIGPPTQDALRECGLPDAAVPEEATVEAAMLALAARLVARDVMDAATLESRGHLPEAVPSRASWQKYETGDRLTPTATTTDYEGSPSPRPP